MCIFLKSYFFFKNFIFIYWLIYWLVVGPHPAMFGHYSWLCTQKSPRRVLGIEPGPSWVSSMHARQCPTALLSLLPQHIFLVFILYLNTLIRNMIVVGFQSYKEHPPSPVQHSHYQCLQSSSSSPPPTCTLDRLSTSLIHSLCYDRSQCSYFSNCTHVVTLWWLHVVSWNFQLSFFLCVRIIAKMSYIFLS